MPLINKGGICATLLGVLFSCSVSAESLFSSVRIQILPNLGIDNLGVENVIPSDIWGRSSTESLKKLIHDIIQKPLTPSMHEIISQMMLRKTPQESSLPLFFRMEVLLQLGRFDDVLTLANLVPPTHQSLDILKLKARALFLSGKTQQACEFMAKTSELSQMREDMRLACSVAKGDKTGSELIFATRLENNELDEITTALGKKLFFNNDVSVDYKEIDARHLHLLGAIGAGIDWTKITLSPMYQKVLSDLRAAPLHIRLEMAEKYYTQRLSKLYAQVDNKTTQNNAVLRAKLYQKIKKTTNDDVLVVAVNEYLESARRDGLFLHLAPVMRPILQTISPSEKNKVLAFNAIQVYALSGNVDLAYPWYQLLQNSADETVKMQGAFLSPLMQQMGGGIPKELEKTIVFCQKNNGAYCEAFLDKIGADINISNWTDILSNMPTSKRYMPLVQSILKGMMTSSRQGEAILYAIKLWQESKGIEKDIIDAVSDAMPKSLMYQLILERYVYL